MVLIALVVLVIVVAVIFIQQALRKIPIQYAKRAAVGRTQMGGQSYAFTIKSECCRGYSGNLCDGISYYTNDNCNIFWYK